MTPLEQQAKLESIVDEFTARVRAGENPAVEQYLEKNPELKDELQELLGSIAMIEDLKRQSANSSNSLGQTFDEIAQLKTLGDYEIVREIGRGGMGIVFEAIHSSLGRRVAIKVLPVRSSTSQNYIERFRREAQAAANLHHTNIVSVFGVGHSDGHHYYVMEFVDGVGLDKVIRELKRKRRNGNSHLNDPATHPDSTKPTRLLSDQNEPPPLKPTRPDAKNKNGNHTGKLNRNGKTLDVNATDEKTNRVDHQALTVADSKQLVSQSLIESLSAPRDRFTWAARLVAHIADALDYAHQQKILHRDIKPGNLILDRKQNIWITDFGLARVENEPSLTQTTEIIGTPQYMAAESFEGNYDRRSEIYCLGVTLYELLALEPAYPQKSTQELIHAITASGPRSINKVDPTIPRDLQTIVNKAVARNPEDRYESAAALRDDLNAFIEMRPITARKMSWIEQSTKWARRNPLVAGLLATSCVLLVAIAVISTIAYAWQTQAVNELADKNQQLKKQQAETETARKLAVENEKKISVQFERAEANVAFTLTALDEMFKQFVLRNNASNIDKDIDGYSELSGIEFVITKEDANYLRSFVNFYEEFAQQNAGNERLNEETARVYRRVANIYHIIGEFDQAIPAYREAIKRYGEIATIKPTDENRLYLVDATNELARTYRKQGRSSAAVRELTNVISTIETWDDPSDQINLELSRTLLLLGTASWRDEAELIRTVTNEPDDNRDNARENGRENGRQRRGRSLWNRFRGIRIDRFGEQYVNRAIQNTKNIAEHDATNPQVRYVLAQAYRTLAIYQFARDDIATGKATIDQAVVQLQSLCQDFPEDDHYRYALALTNIGRSSYLEDPRESLEQAAATAKSLLEKQPGNLEYQQLLANANLFLAEYYVQENRAEDAIELAESALEQFESLSEKYPRVTTYMLNETEIRLILVRALLEQGRNIRAESIIKESIEKLENQRGGRRYSRQMLMWHYQTLARILAQRGRLRESREAAMKAARIKESIPQRQPQNAPPRRRNNDR